MTKDTIQSKSIDYIRFPLIVAILFIHSYEIKTTYSGGNIIENGGFDIFNTTSFFISRIVSDIAVPLFFFISGFLYFYNIKELNRETYTYKTRKRIHTLLIPYLFWNVFAAILYFVAPHIPLISNFTESKHPISTYNFPEFLRIFWDITEGGKPFLGPFWFIRDLIIVSLLSPLIYLIIKHLKLLGLLLLCIYWYFNFPYLVGLSSISLFFFSIGAYFSINKINIVETFNKLFYPSIILYPLICVIDLCTKNFIFNTYIHSFGMMIGMVFALNLVSNGIKNKKLHSTPFLLNVSFFVFATHEPWLIFIRKLVFFILKPNSEILYFLTYFTPIIITITISMSVYCLLKKVAPTFLGVINGGRL